MSEASVLQNSTAGANKKRKRNSDAGNDEGSPKRPSINGDHLDPTTYGAEDFAHHLQSATHAMSETVGNGLGADNSTLPYGSNGDGQNNSFDMVETNHQGTPYNYAPYKHAEPESTTRTKPVVGSAEWHQNRKDCHKEVERRRRETINEGIMSLANIVPDCEKAKGAILQRAVSYVMELRNHIEQLQHENAQTKGTLEGLLAQMTTANTELRADHDSAANEIGRLKTKLQNAGINPDDD